MYEQPGDLLDAISAWHAELVAAAQERAAGHESRALRAAMLATVKLLLAGMGKAPSADDWKLIRLFMDVAAAFFESESGNQPDLFKPVAYGSGGRPMTVAEVSYRAWAARASLAQIHAGCHAGVADQRIADATAWIDDDPVFAKRLGGALTVKTVRNMRLAVEKNDPADRVAQFARGIPSPVEAGRSAQDQAVWFKAQVGSPKGQAY
jgi:hypothetical protein